jgi:hypothetical protein
LLAGVNGNWDLGAGGGAREWRVEEWRVESGGRCRESWGRT